MHPHTIYHKLSFFFLAEENPLIIEARPVFAVLNKKTLSLFENENVNGLIKTIRIQGSITTYQPTDWDTLNCFKVLDSPKEVKGICCRYYRV